MLGEEPERDLSQPSEAEVMAALQRILDSEAFAGVERPSRFLRHVVEGVLRGQQPALKESLLGVDVFRRIASWDPRTDPIVRQEAARLRKRLARYYQNESPNVRIELPVGTYVPVFRKVASQTAFPGESAGLDEASRSVPRALGPAPAPAATPRASRWLIPVAAIVVFVVGAASILTRPHASVSPLSIVVLPFTNLGADHSKDYFADGLTDEITGLLARNPSLRVLARTSAFAFKGKAADVREVGRQLNVTHVLEGSVEWSGEQARISAHLERVSDGSHVWSAMYDRRGGDWLAVQSELAEAVAGALRVNPVTQASRHVPNAEAHELYLRAAFDLQNQVVDSYRRAEDALRQALSIDPQYANAWYQMGVLKFNLSGVGMRRRTPDEVAEAKSLCRRALELDPDLADVHAQLAYILMVSEWDWPGAEQELGLASRNGPRAYAEAIRALWLAYHGRFPEADEHMAIARVLDPVGSQTMIYQGAIRHWEGRYAEAISYWQQLLDRNPNQLNPRLMLNYAYIESGQAKLALAQVEPLASKRPMYRILDVMALAHLGRREEATGLLLRLESDDEPSPGMFRQWLALGWAALGDHEQTVKWLAKSADLPEFQALNLAVNPSFAAMRTDPAFQALVHRIGL